MSFIRCGVLCDLTQIMPCLQALALSAVGFNARESRGRHVMPMRILPLWCTSLAFSRRGISDELSEKQLSSVVAAPMEKFVGVHFNP
jgi:hypothetical protein